MLSFKLNRANMKQTRITFLNYLKNLHRKLIIQPNSKVTINIIILTIKQIWYKPTQRIPRPECDLRKYHWCLVWINKIILCSLNTEWFTKPVKQWYNQITCELIARTARDRSVCKPVVIVQVLLVLIHAMVRCGFTIIFWYY